jgi:pyruvate kinase
MHLGKKTKIVCTIGPKTESPAQMERLLKAGMNVIRMNFSHGDFAEHQGKIDAYKKASAKTGLKAALLQDLSGPKFRIGDFYQERVTLKAGEYITLTSEKIEKGDEKRVSMNYPTLHEELVVGNIVLVDDGKKKFEVVEIKGKEIKCKILVGGDTKGRRSVNLPGANLKIRALTDKDKKDIAFGIKNKVDFVAFSFVKTADEVQELRDILNKAKSRAQIVSKIETPESIENIDSIIEASDAIMIGRGDLAVEAGYEVVPGYQKMIIEKCNHLGKPVITATQMLESMIKNPVPTRAEVSDIANAIYDGTDAIMLSEETTLGDYAVEAVEMMTKIAGRVENELRQKSVMFNIEVNEHSIGESVCESAVFTADNIGSKYIIALSEYGYAVKMLSRYKGQIPLILMTPDQTTFNQSNLSYGTYARMVPRSNSFEDAWKTAKALLVKEKLVKKGDSLVVVSGAPFKKTQESNVLIVETI